MTLVETGANTINSFAFENIEVRLDFVRRQNYKYTYILKILILLNGILGGGNRLSLLLFVNMLLLCVEHNVKRTYVCLLSPGIFQMG